jgi:predicted ATP-grasp superfamily ATP-dependent carboligase
MVVDTLLRPDEMHDPANTSVEAARMLLAVDKYKLPFVLKLPQSSGKGTFIISSNADRVQLTEMLRPQLQQMLEQVTDANQQLYPCSLVLQDYIAGKVMALSLFITRKGRAIFVGCCKQKFNDDGQWAGGSISYAKQAELRRVYSGSMEQAAMFLHQKGYYGPAGIDILTSTSGEQYIIDLNVRITGTFNLGLVAGHFTKRGLDRAMVEAAYFSCSRVKFEEVFAREIRDGRIIITAWTYDESLLLSFGVFIIGGSTSGEMKWQLRQVQNYAVLGLDAIVEC